MKKTDNISHVRGSDSYVEAFGKGLAVLRAFEGEENGLTLSDVADRVGIPPAGARRLLLTLVTLGYARLEGRLFYLNPLVLRLGFAYLSSMPLEELVQPLIDQFSERYTESCTLSVLDQHDIVYVARAKVHSPLLRRLVVGDRLPAHATSTGIVLLGALDEKELTNWLTHASPFSRYTSFTLTDTELLQDAIRRSAEQGWAIAREHLELGVCGFAVPVYDKQQRIRSALTMSINLARYDQDEIIARFLEPLKDLATQISVIY